MLNLSQSRRMDFIVWMDYTSSQPEKSFGLLHSCNLLHSDDIINIANINSEFFFAYFD